MCVFVLVYALSANLCLCVRTCCVCCNLVECTKCKGAPQMIPDARPRPAWRVPHVPAEHACPAPAAAPCCSATFNDEVRALMALSLRQPVRLAADAAAAVPKELRQEVVRLKVHAACVCLFVVVVRFGPLEL